MPSRRRHYPRREPAEPAPPPNITPELTAKVAELVSRCVPLDDAAAACGLGVSEFRGWMRRGANLEQPYRRFAEAVLKAQAEAVAGLAARVHQAGRHDVRANQWLLERLKREQFGRDAGLAQQAVIERLLDEFELALDSLVGRTVTGDDVDRCLAALHARLAGAPAGEAASSTSGEDVDHLPPDP